MIKPFSDDEQSSSIDDLSVENGKEVVVLSGSLKVTRDRIGLNRARELKRLVDAVISTLESDAGLPEEVELANRVDEVPNPFA
ncbi:hypothetical protein LQ954_13830 [Sphingomonas sp. IC-11]|uniref:hypothetical protein n=1 Tax=Sphingomonas sp. IC-11 TaxID=2898528 RepID=UPI001E5B79EE|nr:hypothetical protein [Sphingomonas sp. IC-11]MCD2317222.1 hypothetical protein [Sphingomonas sp. IC-11]